MQRAVLTALGLAVLMSAAQATGRESGTQQLDLTIYQQDLALVREQRQVELPGGRAEIELGGLSEQIRPDSLQVQPPSGVTVQLRSFRPADLSPAALREHYQGQEVLLVSEHPGTGEVLQRRGRLLSLQGEAPVVAVDGRIETLTGDSPWRIAYPEVPQRLAAAPRLALELTGPAGPQPLSLTYLSGGLDWQADYAANLDGDEVRLSGWASLRNDMTRALQADRVQLLAGEVQQANPSLPLARAAEFEAADAAVPERQALGGYHLYDLPGPVDLGPRETVQVPLLETATLPVQREFRTEGAALQPGRGEQPQPVTLRLRFTNPEQGGQPLPAGMLRVYRDDSGGRSQFLGAERIAHTPVGEEVEVEIGRSFDVTAEREQTLYRRLSPEVVELGWRIRLSNARAQAVTVDVVENLGGDWRITETSHPDYRRSAHQARWRIRVPAGGSRELTYQAELR